MTAITIAPHRPIGVRLTGEICASWLDTIHAGCDSVLLRLWLEPTPEAAFSCEPSNDVLPGVIILRQGSRQPTWVEFTDYPEYACFAVRCDRQGLDVCLARRDMLAGSALAERPGPPAHAPADERASALDAAQEDARREPQPVAIDEATGLGRLVADLLRLQNQHRRQAHVCLTRAHEQVDLLRTRDLQHTLHHAHDACVQALLVQGDIAALAALPTLASPLDWQPRQFRERESVVRVKSVVVASVWDHGAWEVSLPGMGQVLHGQEDSQAQAKAVAQSGLLDFVAELTGRLEPSESVSGK